MLKRPGFDDNFDNMVNYYREFTDAQARITPATTQEEIDRALRTCWLEKRPVYLQLPPDVAGVLAAPIMARSTLIRQPAIRNNSRAPRHDDLFDIAPYKGGECDPLTPLYFTALCSASCVTRNKQSEISLGIPTGTSLPVNSMLT